MAEKLNEIKTKVKQAAAQKKICLYFVQLFCHIFTLQIQRLFEVYNLFVVGGEYAAHSDFCAYLRRHYRLKAQKLNGDEGGHCDHCHNAHLFRACNFPCSGRSRLYAYRRNKVIEYREFENHSQKRKPYGYAYCNREGYQQKLNEIKTKGKQAAAQKKKAVKNAVSKIKHLLCKKPPRNQTFICPPLQPFCCCLKTRITACL